MRLTRPSIPVVVSIMTVTVTVVRRVTVSIRAGLVVAVVRATVMFTTPVFVASSTVVATTVVTVTTDVEGFQRYIVVDTLVTAVVEGSPFIMCWLGLLAAF